MKPTIAIAGAGPAGSSLAIRLVRQGFAVTLVERETFPRHKLCGEFISPECFAHLEELGVLDEMLSAGGEHITQTCFYAPGGRSFAVSSNAFSGRGFALSLSRAAMDLRLMEKAKAAGVNVIEDASVSGVGIENGRLTHLTIRRGGERSDIAGDLFVDATGRSRVVTKLAEKRRTTQRKTAMRPLFVGFKAHLSGAPIIKNTCEIYLFPGGYGGLSPIEIGLTNFCFLVRPAIAREFAGDANEIVRRAAFRNKRAAATLANFEAVSEWLAVSVDSFGLAIPANMTNLLSVGDSAAFIDPFTGSGMLLAFESSALLAHAISQTSPDLIYDRYLSAYRKRFAKRLWFCSALRRAVFIPCLPAAAISLLSLSSRSRDLLAGSTRSRRPDALGKTR